MAWFRGVGLGWRAGLAHRGARGRLGDARLLALPALLRRDARHWLIQQVLELHVGGARTQTLLNAGEGVMRGHVAGNQLATHMKRDVERAVRRHRPRERADGLYVFGDPLIVRQQRQLIDFAAQQRIPAVYSERSWSAAGSLMAYGPHYPAIYRRAAYYVDRILKGAKPADLPVEQPREFELVINLTTARALGLTIPELVLQQATEVIQ